MNNSVFGNSIENVRSRVNVELVNSKAMKALRAHDCKYRRSLARLKTSVNLKKAGMASRSIAI